MTWLAIVAFQLFYRICHSVILKEHIQRPAFPWWGSLPRVRNGYDGFAFPDPTPPSQYWTPICSQAESCLRASEEVTAYKRIAASNYFPCDSDKPLSFEEKKNIANDTSNPDYKRMIEHLTALRHFREVVVHELWNCYVGASKCTMECPAHLHQPINSDYDCSIQGPTPQPMVAAMTHALKCLIETELHCIVPPTKAREEEYVEYVFDTNFYGDLTAIPGSNFDQFKYMWAIDDREKELLFQGVSSIDAELYWVMRQVCHYDTMSKIVKKRIAMLQDLILTDEAALPPPNSSTPELRAGALRNLYTKLAQDQYWNDASINANSFDWGAFFTDLSTAASFHNDAYLTYAGVYDVVIRGQIGLVPLYPLTVDQEMCIDEIATMENFAFVLQHLLTDVTVTPLGGTDTPTMTSPILLAFLTKSSSYWARMHYERTPAECHKMIELGPVVNARRSALKIESPLFVQYATYFERCIDLSPIVDQERSEVMDQLESVFHTFF